MEPAKASIYKVVAEALKNIAQNDQPVCVWPLVCGAAVAERTRALDFREGTLRVQVPDATWRTQLRDLAAAYVGAINKVVAVQVKRIEFVVEAEQKAAE